MALNRRRAGKILMFAVLVAGLAAFAANREALRMDSLTAWVAGFGLLAPVVFIAMRSIGAVFFVPASLLAITAGVLFGPVWGAVYNLLASVTGAVLAFLIARYLARDWVAARLGGRTKTLVEGVEAEGWRFVAFVRLVPLFPYNLLNYALGATAIKFSHFVFASAVFMIPGDIAYTYIGYAGREAIAGREGSIKIALIALALLAVIGFLPRLIRRLRLIRQREEAGTGGGG